MIYGKIWNDATGYVINDGQYAVREHTTITIEMVEAYLAEHPEALVPEPVPPPPSAEELLRQEEQTLLAYLSSTDWYAVRYAETGEPIPTAIKAERATARTRISEIRGA